MKQLIEAIEGQIHYALQNDKLAVVVKALAEYIAHSNRGNAGEVGLYLARAADRIRNERDRVVSQLEEMAKQYDSLMAERNQMAFGPGKAMVQEEMNDLRRCMDDTERWLADN